MLKSWSIENFKAIVNSGELKLAPVTVLAGRNSSGKSSLIQSILMIAQTLSNQVPDRALLPNERIVQLGTFEDILNENSGSRILAVGFELEMVSEERKSSSIQRSAKTRLEVKSIKVTAKFSGANSNGSSSSAIEASNAMVENVFLELDWDFKSLDEGIEFLGQAEVKPKLSLITQKITNTELTEFLQNVAPNYLRFVPYNSKQPNYFGFLTAYANENSDPCLVTLSHFLPTRLIQKFKLQERPRERETEGLEIVNNIDVETFGQVVEQIIRFFTSRIRYLGPLRVDPGVIQRSFPPTSELDEVGAKGEYSAVVYHANQNAVVEWYNPQTRQNEQGSLQEALDGWSQYLGIAHQIRAEMAGALGVTWKVVIKEGQKARTLPEVGGGVNHVLPILVMGLLAPSNTLLIIEEPEVTLHARVQALLGDFFVGLSKCKKQCLIETHSENLVSQLRYHIVQLGGQEESGCMIYFVDQDEEGAAKFEPIEISARGNIMNWPDGFFDETMHQEDRINAASIRRRAKLAKNG